MMRPPEPYILAGSGRFGSKFGHSAVFLVPFAGFAQSAYPAQYESAVSIVDSCVPVSITGTGTLEKLQLWKGYRYL